MTDKLAENVARKFIQAQECALAGGCSDEEALAAAGCLAGGCPEDGEVMAEAPPGWEGPIKEMKKDKDIDNPWALAWYMKNKGDKVHKESMVVRVAVRHLKGLGG